MVGPLGGDDADQGAPTTHVGDVDGKPLGGTVRDLGAPTTYVEDVNGGPPTRHYRRSKSAHHLCQRH
jgi:hypothetical protein